MCWKVALFIVTWPSEKAVLVRRLDKHTYIPVLVRVVGFHTWEQVMEGLSPQQRDQLEISQVSVVSS